MHKRPNLCDYHLFHYRGFNYKVRCQVIGKENTTCLFIKYLYPMPLASLLYCTFIINYQGSSIKSKAPFLCTFITQLTLNSLSYFKSYQWKRICTQWHINQHTPTPSTESLKQRVTSAKSMRFTKKNRPGSLLHQWIHYFYETLWECVIKYQTHWANILKSQHTGYLTNIQDMFFSQFVVLFAPSYYQLLLFDLYVDHDKRYVFHKITHLSITRTLVLIFPLPNSTSRAVQAQLAVQAPWCQIAEDILVAVTNCLLVGCAECCSGSIGVVYVSVTWLGGFNARWFHPPPPSFLSPQCIFQTYLGFPVKGALHSLDREPMEMPPMSSVQVSVGWEEDFVHSAILVFHTNLQAAITATHIPVGNALMQVSALMSPDKQHSILDTQEYRAF